MSADRRRRHLHIPIHRRGHGGPRAEQPSMEEGNSSQHPDAATGWRKLLRAMHRREGEELHPLPTPVAQDQTLIHDHSWLQAPRCYGAGNCPRKNKDCVSDIRTSSIKLEKRWLSSWSEGEQKTYPLSDARMKYRF